MRQSSRMPAAAATRLRCMALAVGLVFVAEPGGAAEPTPIRVNAFPNAKALPLHAGIAKGIFDKRGFAIELHLTENSRSQREGLAAGKFDVVHSAVDNASP
jgi:ABC-type nitrate/sulfonate/bicarbonate transport system substrate-binding protein